MRYNSTEEIRDVLQQQMQDKMPPQTPAQYASQSGMLGMAGTALGMANQGSPKRPPEIQVASATLLDRVNVLAKVFSDLEQRLEYALRPDSPSTAKAVPPSPGYGANTQLGQAMAQASISVDAVINRIRDLLDRLEI